METTEDIDGSVLVLARSNQILARLVPATVERLLRFGRPCNIVPEDVLVRQGDQSDCAYLILDGELEVLVDTTYGEVLLARVSQGAFIGEIGVFAGLPRNATVRAKTFVRALRFDRAPLLEAGDSDPALLRSIISRLGGQVGSFNNALGLYTNAVSALERDDFELSILDQLRQPAPELMDFAQQFRRMAEQIVQRRAHQEEMASAAAIQRAMLPNAQPTLLAGSQLDIFAHMKPAREVGGDLYDMFELDGNRLVITVGDVCGKGVPASLFMAVTQTVMRLVLRASQDLQAEMAAANDLLIANNRGEMFATLFCGVLDIPSATLTYCNCGHNPPLVVRRDGGALESLRACGPPLGMIEGITHAPRSIALAPGDLLLLYSDGVTEAEDAATAQFGSERLEQLARELRGSPARQVVEGVIESVGAFANGAPQSDDITCMAVVCNER